MAEQLPGWVWFIIVPVGFILVIIILGVVFFAWELVWMNARNRRKYARLAKRQNKKAREARLQRADWEGIPLPSGREGHLTITRAVMVQHPFSFRQLEKAMSDRAKDLGVDILVRQSELHGDVIVQWRKAKKKK